MRSPEGQDYPLVGEFFEVVKPSKLVMTMDLREHPAEFFAALDALRPSEEKGKPFAPRATITFEEAFGRTTVTVVQRLESAADAAATAKLGAIEGWAQSFERLDALLGVRG